MTPALLSHASSLLTLSVGRSSPAHELPQSPTITTEILALPDVSFNVQFPTPNILARHFASVSVVGGGQGQKDDFRDLEMLLGGHRFPEALEVVPKYAWCTAVHEGRERCSPPPFWAALRTVLRSEGQPTADPGSERGAKIKRLNNTFFCDVLGGWATL